MILTPTKTSNKTIFFLFFQNNQGQKQPPIVPRNTTFFFSKHTKQVQAQFRTFSFVMAILEIFPLFLARTLWLDGRRDSALDELALSMERDQIFFAVTQDSIRKPSTICFQKTPANMWQSSETRSNSLSRFLTTCKSELCSVLGQIHPNHWKPF